MAKSNTSSYVVTYELAFNNDNPSSVLDKLEKIAKAIYNDCLNECLKRYHKLIHDRKYQELLKEYKASNNKKEYLKQYADLAFSDKKELLGNRFSEYCRLCTLKALDDGWIEEVDYLQQLQAAISGRSTAQRNLLYEYQREARLSFRDMEKSIKKAMIRNILLGEVSFGKDNEMIILYP